MENNIQTITDIQSLIADYRARWIAANQWQDPDAADALLFCLTELGEAITCEGSREERATELFDTLMMALIALEKMGGRLMPVDVHRQADALHTDLTVLLAQAAEVYLRSKGGYVRNNERTTEAAGIALSKLCYLVADGIHDLTGDVIGIAEAKLKKMDAKRMG